MRRYWRLSLGVVLAALVLSGCSISIMNTIYEDGSGIIDVSYTFTAYDRSSLGIQDCQDAVDQDYLEEADYNEIIADDGDLVCTDTSVFLDLDELSQRMNSYQMVTVNEISIENYRLTYDIDVFPDSSSYTLYWAIAVPGNLVTTTADNHDSGMHVWQLTPSQNNNILVISDLPIPTPTPTPTPRPTATPRPTPAPTAIPAGFGGGGGGNISQASASSPLPLIGGGMLVLGLVAAGAVVFIRRRQATPAPQAAAFYQAPPQGGYPPPQAGYPPPYETPSQPYYQAPPTQVIDYGQQLSDPVEQRLQRLAELRSRGILSEEEYQAQRRKILEDL